MAKMRDRYFKGYVKEMVPTGKEGKYKATYVYHGNYYYWRASHERIKGLKGLFAALLLVDMAVFFAAVSAGGAAAKTGLLMIPALLSLIPLLYEIIGVVQFCRTKDKVREFDFEEMNVKLRYSTLVRGAMLAAGAAAAVVWSFFAQEALSYLLMALELAVSAACALTIHVIHRPLGTALVEEGDYGDIKDESGPTMFEFVPIAGSNRRDRKIAERIKKFLR